MEFQITDKLKDKLDSDNRHTDDVMRVHTDLNFTGWISTCNKARVLMRDTCLPVDKKPSPPPYLNVVITKSESNCYTQNQNAWIPCCSK